MCETGSAAKTMFVLYAGGNCTYRFRMMDHLQGHLCRVQAFEHDKAGVTGRPVGAVKNNRHDSAGAINDRGA
jgi:hypothetical protein